MAKRNGTKGPKQRNRGGNGNCAVCNHDQKAQIEAALVDGTAYREISKRFGMSIAGLSRHKSLHMTDEVITPLHAATAVRGDQTFLERMEQLMVRADQQLVAAERGRKGSLALLAVREYGRLLELWGKATGELDERPVTTINLQTTQEWIQIRTVILEVLAPHPELRMQLARRLEVLEGGAA